MILYCDSLTDGMLNDGGSHRSRQIQSLLERAGVSYTKKIELNWSWTSLAKGVVKLAVRSKPGTWRFALQRFRPTIANAARLTNSSDVNVVINERLYWNPSLFIAASATKRTIALPQNIESFVPNQARQLSCKESLDRSLELRLLQLADSCFCICEEDASLIRDSRGAAYVLPYHPPEEIAMNLGVIRQRRLKSVKRHYLVLGSFTNPPTAQGMEQLVKELYAASGALCKNNIKVVIAGNESQQLSKYSSDAINIRGRVTSAELSQLLEESVCLVANHVATTGCLTRVTEALHAGVPVWANAHAVRGHWDKKGIEVFENAQAIVMRILNGENSLAIPPEPCKCEEADGLFIEVVSRMYNS